MDVTVGREELTRAVFRVQGAASDKNLSQIALRTSQGSLEVCAADRWLVVFAKALCSVSDHGAVFLSARLFLDLMRELPSGPIRMVQDAQSLNVSGGGFSIKLPLLAHGSWPESPMDHQEGGGACVVQFPGDRLAYMVRQIQYCLPSGDGHRAFADVACLQRSPDFPGLRLMASDGFRLAVCDGKITDLPADFLASGCTLPRKSLLEWGKFCEQSDSVELAVSEDQTVLMAKTDTDCLYVLLSASPYPQYGDIFPKTIRSEVALPKELCQGVIKRVLLAADDTTRALHLAFSSQSLVVTAKNTSEKKAFEAREEIPLESHLAESFEIFINGKYLSDVAQVVSGSVMNLVFSEADAPVLLRPSEEPEGCRSVHVLVPVVYAT